ncbi:ABC transporter substrate-binding protein [Desulfovibrio sp. OttesenSCG-928-I05]|nr:ABC transporter substrate-binding protein [Desulfovibrio sp. OttesenSCG-928-I05]
MSGIKHDGITRRAFLKGAAAASAGLMVSSLPGVLHAAAAPKPGGTFKITVAREIKSLNPLRHVNIAEYMQGELMYSGLTKLNADMNAVGDLAESWESKDAVTWRFNLRKGVTFHNGKPLTAADVVATMRKLLDPATASPGMKNIGPVAAVEAEGSHVVKVTTSSPYSFLPKALSYPCFKVLPEEVVNGDFDAAGSKDFGSGPFRLKEYVAGSHLIVEKNPDYFIPGRPYLNEVHVLYFPDPLAEINALLTGQVDMVNEVNPAQIGRLEKNKDVTVMHAKSGRFVNTVFDCQAAPFSDPRVRKALTLSMDREAALLMALEGYGSIGNDTPISPAYPFYHEMPQRQQDMAAAAKLLQEAGIKKGTKLQLDIAVSPAVRGKLGIVIQQAAKELGLNVELKQFDYSTYLDTIWLKSPYYVGFYNMQSSEDACFQLLYTSTSPWNETRWNNATFDKLVIDARAELNEDKQRKLYADIQEMMYEEVPTCIPLFLDLTCALTPNIHDYRMVPRGTYWHLENVWKS